LRSLWNFSKFKNQQYFINFITFQNIWFQCLQYSQTHFIEIRPPLFKKSSKKVNRLINWHDASEERYNPIEQIHLMSRQIQVFQHISIQFWMFGFNQLFNYIHVISYPRHIGWAIYWPYFVVLLEQLDEDPERYLFIAVIHERCHNEVHALHVADWMIIVCKCL